MLTKEKMQRIIRCCSLALALLLYASAVAAAAAAAAVAEDDGGAGAGCPNTTPLRHHIALDAAAGAVAGAISRTLIGPLDVVKIRLQVQREPISAHGGGKLPSHYTGFLQALSAIVAEEGLWVRRACFLPPGIQQQAKQLRCATLQLHLPAADWRRRRACGLAPCLACC